MKYYIIAGEASGDLHGSNLIKEIYKNDPAATIRCWGGDLMEDAGADLVKHYRDLAFMGFIEVIKNLGTILSNIKFCKSDIEDFKPDVLVLIDYPGFNLRIAKWAKLQKIKIVYYISPQVWAWKENRVKMMKDCIDKMIVILPFEKDFFKTRWNWNVDYVGHPLVEVIDNWQKQNEQINLSDKPIVAILPGSRKQEIEQKLPVMLEVSGSFPDFQFIVAKAPGVDDSFYHGFISAYTNVSTTSNATYNLLSQSKAALVTSGTATLETALFGVPEVVCYKGSSISYQIAKRLINIRFISLVNLIMDKMVVKELIQHEFNKTNLKKELTEILQNDEKIYAQKKDYAALRNKLQFEGHASANAAKIINNFLQ
jgi:lipid-A-disaccharide synthase